MFTQNINLKVLGNIKQSNFLTCQVTQNALLYNFGASEALLSGIDISQNLLLESLQEQGKRLTSLDISNQ